MADEVDEDPVVDEVDVFLSKSLSDNLYLMQYPLRPVNMGYGHFDHLAARVKPQQKRVELELALDTHSKNYSSSKGELIAANVDGNVPPHAADRIFTGPKMNKILLSCPPHTKSFSNCQYAVGLFKDGGLHLTPMNAVVQMRPTFEYLDKADTRHRSEASNTSINDGGESSQDEGEDEATPVNMKVSRGESEEFKARRMASYEFINQKREEERWINVTYHTSESGLSEAERQQLQVGDVPHMSQFKISPQEYLQSLIPPSSEDKSEKPAMPDNVLSLNELRKLDLNDQIRALLINVKVIRFSQLMSFLAPGTDHPAVLRSLQSMAVLVQGSWVVKSELVYPDEEDSIKKKRPHSAVSPELLRRVRDYAMWKFTHNKHVVRKDISSIVQLPSDEVKEILEKMSKLKARTGWEFLYDYDRDFCERHTEIVQRQRSKWALTFHTLAQHFKMPKDGDKKALEMEMALMNQQPTERHRARRLSSRSPRKRSLSGRSQSDMSDMEIDNIGDKGHHQDKHHPDKHKILESPACRNILDSDPQLNGSVYSSGHLPNGVCQPICDSTLNSANISKGLNSVDIARIKPELEKFVKEALSETSLLCMSDIRSKMSMYTARVPSASVFNSGVSDKMIEDAVIAVGGFRLKNQWPASRKPEPIYSTYTGNEGVDQLRKILFSLFEESPKLRSGTFRNRAKEAGIELSETEMRKFLKDHCDALAATWYLKRTLPSSS